MIPSFYPANDEINRQAFEWATEGLSEQQKELAGTPFSKGIDPDTGLEIRSLAELLANSSKVRYADNPRIDYAALVRGEVAPNTYRSPLTKGGDTFWKRGRGRRIAVIGAGMSGLLSAWHLVKLGATVDVYEATSQITNNTNEGTLNSAGRIRTYSQEDENWELGAMRFPDTSALFWHYINLFTSGEDDEYGEFPNPGKVPSIFSGETRLTPLWSKYGIDLTSIQEGEINYYGLQSRHLKALTDIKVEGTTLGQLSMMLTGGGLSDSEASGAYRIWREIEHRYYRTSYRDFLRQQKFTAREIDAIGYMGLGTGGFKPLFDVCVLDILRLITWSYAGEYQVRNLKKLPQAMATAVRTLNGSIKYDTPIKGIIFDPVKKIYRLCAEPRGGSLQLLSNEYERVVCAMTHRAVDKLFESFPNQAQETVISASFSGSPVYPFSRVKHPDIESAFYSDLKRQSAMSSVKIFQGIPGQGAFWSYPINQAPDQTKLEVGPHPYGREVKVFFGKNEAHPSFHVDWQPIGVSYILALKPGYDQFSETASLTGLNYSWGADSVKVGTYVGTQPTLDARIATSGHAFGDVFGELETEFKNVALLVADSVDARYLNAQGDAKTIVSIKDSADFYRRFKALSDGTVHGYKEEMAIVDWDRSPYVYMGFKLDAPGRGNPSVNRFRTQSRFENLVPYFTKSDRWDDGEKSDYSVAGIYFCGDSFSNYGGWVEGAFQSAIHAVISIASRDQSDPDVSVADTINDPLSDAAHQVVNWGTPPFDTLLYPAGPTFE